MVTKGQDGECSKQRVDIKKSKYLANTYMRWLGWNRRAHSDNGSWWGDGGSRNKGIWGGARTSLGGHIDTLGHVGCVGCGGRGNGCVLAVRHQGRAQRSLLQTKNQIYMKPMIHSLSYFVAYGIFWSFFQHLWYSTRDEIYVVFQIIPAWCTSPEALQEHQVLGFAGIVLVEGGLVVSSRSIKQTVQLYQLVGWHYWQLDLILEQISVSPCALHQNGNKSSNIYKTVWITFQISDKYNPEYSKTNTNRWKELRKLNWPVWYPGWPFPGWWGTRGCSWVCSESPGCSTSAHFPQQDCAASWLQTCSRQLEVHPEWMLVVSGFCQCSWGG